MSDFFETYEKIVAPEMKPTTIEEGLKEDELFKEVEEIQNVPAIDYDKLAELVAEKMRGEQDGRDNSADSE